MATWNPHEELFASQISTSFQFISVCEFLVMGISCVYNLFLNGRMESKISEANSHIIILDCENFTLMAIS